MYNVPTSSFIVYNNIYIFFLWKKGFMQSAIIIIIITVYFKSSLFRSLLSYIVFVFIIFKNFVLCKLLFFKNFVFFLPYMYIRIFLLLGQIIFLILHAP